MKKENEKTKGKKKHVILKGIGIFILAIFALCIIFPGNEEEGESKKAATPEEIEQGQDDTEAQQIPGEQNQTEENLDKAATRYYKVGDTVSLLSEDSSDNGTIDLLITDIGLDHNEYDTDLLYVSVEIINNSTASVYISPTGDFNLYVDDYQYDTTSAETRAEYLSFEPEDAIIGGQEVNSGRKGKYTFRTAVTEEQLNGRTIELELYSGILILFKEDGEWLYDKSE